MKAFQKYLTECDVRLWDELTHKQVSRLCALWVAENQEDFECSIWSIEPNNRLAELTISLFDALARSDMNKMRISRHQMSCLIQDTVIDVVKTTAESWLQMKRDWLRELTVPTHPVSYDFETGIPVRGEI